MYDYDEPEYTTNRALADNAAEEAYERAIEAGMTEDEAYAISQGILRECLEEG